MLNRFVEKLWIGFLSILVWCMPNEQRTLFNDDSLPGEEHEEHY
jgi:hypothetical protein